LKIISFTGLTISGIPGNIEFMGATLHALAKHKQRNKTMNAAQSFALTFHSAIETAIICYRQGVKDALKAYSVARPIVLYTAAVIWVLGGHCFDAGVKFRRWSDDLVERNLATPESPEDAPQEAIATEDSSVVQAKAMAATIYPDVVTARIPVTVELLAEDGLGQKSLKDLQAIAKGLRISQRHPSVDRRLNKGELVEAIRNHHAR
jgi:hypothetical protein